MAQATNDESRNWRELPFQTDERMVIAVVAVLIGVAIGYVLFNEDGYVTNLYTEAISIGLTVFVLNQLAERREDARRIKDLQDRLVMEAGSTSNETAKAAVSLMRKQGWLTSKDKIHLLQGADLGSADLSGANLRKARLGNAKLRKAIINHARLYLADLSDVDFWSGSLNGSEVRATNFRGANFDNVTLNDVVFHAETILPDGEPWSAGNALERLRAAGARWDEENPPYEVDWSGNRVSPGADAG